MYLLCIECNYLFFQILIVFIDLVYYFFFLLDILATVMTKFLQCGINKIRSFKLILTHMKHLFVFAVRLVYFQRHHMCMK